MSQPSSIEDLAGQRSIESGRDEFQFALQSAQSGSSSGFLFIYNKFNQTIGAVVRAEGSTSPDDTVNTVFEKAFRSFDRFVGTESNFASFLYQIARFQCLDEQRERNRQVSLQASPLQDSASDDSSDQIIREQSASAARVNKAMRSLTNEQREVVALRVFFGLTGPQTSEALERPISEIRRLQNLAEARLKILVEPEIAAP